MSHWFLVLAAVGALLLVSGVLLANARLGVYAVAAGFCLIFTAMTASYFLPL